MFYISLIYLSLNMIKTITILIILLLQSINQYKKKINLVVVSLKKNFLLS